MYNRQRILLGIFITLSTFSLHGAVAAAGPSAVTPTASGHTSSTRWTGIANPALLLSPEQEEAEKYADAFRVLRGAFEPFSTGVHHKPVVTHIRNESDFVVRITGRRENGKQIIFYLDKKNQDKKNQDKKNPDKKSSEISLDIPDKKSSEISLDIIEDLQLHGLIIEKKPTQLISLAAAQGAISIPSKVLQPNSSKEDLEEETEALPSYIHPKHKEFYQAIVKNHPPITEQPKHTLIAQIRYIEQSELHGPHHVTLPMSHGVLIDFGETDQTKMIDFHQTYPGFTVIIKNKSLSTSGPDNTTTVDIAPTYIDQNVSAQQSSTHIFTKEKLRGTATVGRRGTMAQ